MAWTSMHFAVGMCGGTVLGGVAFLIAQRGWRLLPAAMTLGGIWACVPDSPRLFREDFPSLGLAATLGSKDFERWLHSFGDLFFFHSRLDAQPREFALHGLAIIIALYNLAFVVVMLSEWRARRHVARRLWEAHAPHMERARERTNLRLAEDHSPSRRSA